MLKPGHKVEGMKIKAEHVQKRPSIKPDADAEFHEKLKLGGGVSETSSRSWTLD
jgi:hypothetical protein